ERPADRETREANLHHAAEIRRPFRFRSLAGVLSQPAGAAERRDPHHQVDEQPDEAVIAQDLEVDAVRGTNRVLVRTVLVEQELVLIAHSAAEEVLLRGMPRDDPR